MNLPGSPRTHVWVGLLVALGGVLMGGWAYTGDRIYHIEFLPVALLGLVLVVAGSSLAGYGQANRPRLGGRPDEDDEAEETGGRSSLLERVKAVVGLGDDEGPRAEGAGGNPDAEGEPGRHEEET